MDTETPDEDEEEETQLLETAARKADQIEGVAVEAEGVETPISTEETSPKTRPPWVLRNQQRMPKDSTTIYKQMTAK